MSEPSNTPEEIKFRSSDIGTVTARHEDMFKEHKARAAEEKAKNDRLRRKLLIILGALAALLLGALSVWWLVGVLGREEEVPQNIDTKPIVQFHEDTVNDNIAELQNLAEDAYSTPSKNTTTGVVTVEYDMAAAEAAFTEALAAPSNAAFANQIKLAQLVFYANNGKYASAIALASQIDTDALSNEQKLKLYNSLFLANSGLGDEASANDYLQLQTNTQVELNGGGQG